MTPPVMLYALSTCIHCRNAKEYLDQCSVPYEFTYVDKLTGDEKKAVVDKVRTLNSAVSFPTIVVGDQVLVGFNKDKLNAALGR